MSIGAVPLIPPLPEYERQTDASDSRARGGGAERKVMSPEQTAALAGLDQSTADQIAGSDEVRKHKEAENAITSDMADQQAKAAGQRALLTESAIDQGAKIRDAAIARAKDAQAKYDAAPPAKFFRDGDTWGNALRGVALMLSGAGDAMQKAAAIRTGHAAPATHGWQDLIESDLNEQKAHLQRLSDNVVTARTGISDATEARRQMLSDIDLRGEAVYKRLEAVAKARLAALGMKAPEIEQHQAVLALKAARAQKQADYVAPAWESIHSTWENTHKSGVEETHRVPTATGKGPTESQAKTADLSAGMLNELKTIESLPPLSQDALAKVQSNELSSNAADSATGLTGVVGAKIGRAVGIIPKTKYDGLSPESQRSMNAWDSLVELRARQLTGAGMPNSEAIREARTLGYSPGDSTEVMQQKIARLKESATRGMTLSGPAGQQLQQGGSEPGGSHTPAAAGSTPAPATEPPPFKAEPSPRDKVIELLKADPNRPGAAQVMKRFNITPEELR